MLQGRVTKFFKNRWQLAAITWSSCTIIVSNTYGQAPATVTLQADDVPLRVVAGSRHSCALVQNGVVTRVRCWGDNSLCQSTIPLALANPVDIRAQGNRTCAVQAGESHVEDALKCWPIGVSAVNGGSTDTDGDGVPDGIDKDPTDGFKTSDEQNATYTYNHLGQRMSKTVGTTTTYFVYSNTDGQLLGEYNSAGQAIRTYVYLEGERVAMLVYNNSVSPPTKETIFLANNHIGQAQYAWDEDGNPRYERKQTPFGEGMIEPVGNVDVPHY